MSRRGGEGRRRQCEPLSAPARTAYGLAASTPAVTPGAKVPRWTPWASANYGAANGCSCQSITLTATHTPAKPRKAAMAKAPAMQFGRWRRAHFPWYGLPAAPACYAIYVNGTLEYVGATVDLRARIHKHGIDFAHYKNVIETPWGRARTVLLKYRPSVKYGDWAMVELRLIHRLHPPENKRDAGKARGQDG